jgi:arsenate reductase (glutaredoxin)
LENVIEAPGITVFLSRGNMTMRIYTLSNCDTCRDAMKWLRGRGLDFEERAIRETPPTPDELRTMLVAYDGEVRRLFNTAGRDYREQGLGEKLPTLTAAAAIALLAANGNLVKRPFLIGERVALVGFKEETWSAVFVK